MKKDEMIYELPPEVAEYEREKELENRAVDIEKKYRIYNRIALVTFVIRFVLQLYILYLEGTTDMYRGYFDYVYRITPEVVVLIVSVVCGAVSLLFSIMGCNKKETKLSSGLLIANILMTYATRTYSLRAVEILLSFL